MSLWPLPITDEHPDTLDSWSIHEVLIAALGAPTRHLVGYAVEDREGRVSSPIVEFDAATRRARTKSGRVYRLRGSPGTDPDADHVWRSWQQIHKAQVLREVTRELFPKSGVVS